MNSDPNKQVKKLPRPSAKGKDFAKSMLAAYRRRRRKRKLKRSRFSKDKHLNGGENYKIIINSMRVRRKLFPHQLPVTIASKSKANYSLLFSKPICNLGSGRAGQHRSHGYHPPNVKRKRGRPKGTGPSEIRAVRFFGGDEHFGNFIYNARCLKQLKDGSAVGNECSSLLKSAALNSVERDESENDVFQVSCLQRKESEISFLDQVNAAGVTQESLDPSGFEGHSGVIVDLHLESREPCPAIVVSGVTEVESSRRKDGPCKDEAQSTSGDVEEECIEAGCGDDDDASLLKITTTTMHSEASKKSQRKGNCRRISSGTKATSEGHVDEDGLVKKPRMDVQEEMSTVGVPGSHSSKGRGGQVCKGVYIPHCNSKRCSNALAQNDWYCLQVNGTGIRLRRDKRRRALEDKVPQRGAVKMLNQCRPCSVVLVDFLKCLNIAPCSSAPSQSAPNWNGTLSCKYAADRTLRLIPISEVHGGVAPSGDQLEERFGSLQPVATSLEDRDELLHAVELYSSAAESYCVWSSVDFDDAQTAVRVAIPEVESDVAATPDVRTDDGNVLFRFPKLQKICDFADQSLKSAATSELVMGSGCEDDGPILAEDVVSNTSALLSKELAHDCSEMSMEEGQEIEPVVEATPEPFSCLHCIYKTSDHVSIREHVYIHTDVIPFTCGHCGSLFGTRSNVSLHSEREHTHDEPCIIEDSTVCVEKHYRNESFVPGKSQNSDCAADVFYTSSEFEFTNLNIDLTENTIGIKNDKADDMRKNMPAVDASEPCKASESEKDFAMEVLPMPTEDSDVGNLGTDPDGINLIGLQDAKSQFSSCGPLDQELVVICESCPPPDNDLIEVNQEEVQQHDTNKTTSEYLDVPTVIFAPIDTCSSSHGLSKDTSSFANLESECQEDITFSERHDTLQIMDDTRVSGISIDIDTSLPSTVCAAEMFYMSSEYELTNLNIDLLEATVGITNDKADDKRKNMPAIDAGEPCKASESKPIRLIPSGLVPTLASTSSFGEISIITCSSANNGKSLSSPTLSVINDGLQKKPNKPKLYSKQYCCQYCDYATSEVSDIESHVFVMHPRQRRLVCPVCNVYFCKFKPAMLAHFSSQHRKVKPVFIYEPSYRLLTADTCSPATHAKVKTKKKLAKLYAGSPPKSRRGKQDARISKVKSKVTVLDDVGGREEGSGIQDINVDPDPKDWSSVPAHCLEDIARSCVWSECLDREGREVQDAGIATASDEPDPVLPPIQNDPEKSCIWFECSVALFEDCLESNRSGTLTGRESEIVIQIDNSSIMEKQVVETVELDGSFLENGNESMREDFIHGEKPDSFLIVSGDEDMLRAAAELLASGENEDTSHIQSKDFEIVKCKNDKETAVDDCCNENKNNNNNSQKFSAVGFVDCLNNGEALVTEITSEIESEELQDNCCEEGERTNTQESFCQDFHQNFTSVDPAKKSNLTEAGELVNEEAVCEQTSTDMDGKQEDDLYLEKKKISDSDDAKFDCNVLDEAMVRGVSFDEEKYLVLDDVTKAVQCIVEKSSCETIDLDSVEDTSCQGIIEVDKQIQDGSEIIGPGNCRKTEGSVIDRSEFDAMTVEQDEAFPSGSVTQEEQRLEEESEGETQRDISVNDIDLEVEIECSVQSNVGHPLNGLDDYSGRSANAGESVEVGNLSSDVNPDHDNFPKDLGSCGDVQSCDGDSGDCGSSIGGMLSSSKGQDKVIETRPVCFHEEPETDEVISCLYSRISDDDTISERNSDGHTDDSVPLILAANDERTTEKSSASETGERQNVELDRSKFCEENGKNLDHLERMSDTVDDTKELTEECIKDGSKPCLHVSKCSSTAVATASIEPESTSSKDGTDQVVHHTGSRREEGAAGGAPPEDCMCLEVSSTSDDTGVNLSEGGLRDRRLVRRSAALVSCEVHEEEEILDVENCAEEQLERGGDAIGVEDGSDGLTETVCKLCSFVSDCGTEMSLHVEDAHRRNSSGNLVRDVDFCGKVVDDGVVVREPNNNEIDQSQRVCALDAVELENSQPKTSNHSHIEIQLPDDDDEDDVIFMGLEKCHVSTDSAKAYPTLPTNYISNISCFDDVTATYATCYSITSPLSTKRTAACRPNPISSASSVVPVGVSRRRSRHESRDVELAKNRERVASPAEPRTASLLDTNSVSRHRAMGSKQRLLLTDSNPRPSNPGSMAFVTRSISRPIMTSTLHPMPAHSAEPSRAISSAYERKTSVSATVTANQGGADVLLDYRVLQRRDAGGRSQHPAVDGLPPPLMPISELKVMRQPLRAHSNYRESPLAGQYGSHSTNLSRDILWGRVGQSQEQTRPAVPPPAHSKLQVGSSFMKPNSWTTIDNSGLNRNRAHMDSSCYRYSAPNLPPGDRAVRDSDARRRSVMVESHRPLFEQFGREPRKETLAKHAHTGAPFGQNTRLPRPASTYPSGSVASPTGNSCLLCPFQATDCWSLYHHLQSHISL